MEYLNPSALEQTGEIDVSMEIETEAPRKLQLHIKVRDTGVGIPPDKLDTIFDAFQQGDGSNTREYEGTGLGLAICKQIAGLMRGDVWAESTPGKGSVFHFTPWLDKSEKPNIPVQAGDVGGAPKNRVENNLHILLAEDNPINQKLARFMLTKAGMNDYVAKPIKQGIVLEMVKKWCLDR
ncbi:MAG: hypothetical protein GY940_32095 [bacterium]|nr:hypothetical protein [bacterium]